MNLQEKQYWQRKLRAIKHAKKKPRPSAELIPMIAEAERLLEPLAHAAAKNEELLEERRIEVSNLEAANTLLRDEISRLLREFHENRSFISRLLNESPPPIIKKNIEYLQSKIEPLPKRLNLITIRETVGDATWHKYNYDLFRANPSTAVSQDTLKTLLKQINSIRRELEKSSRQENKKAKLAAADNQTRNLANQIKEKIRQQLLNSLLCPYCGNDIGDSPEADHIYPVESGGLSTPENMVYVCFDCNRAKSSLTLSMFIKKMGFDREEVEARLEQLGKRF